MCVLFLAGFALYKTLSALVHRLQGLRRPRRRVRATLTPASSEPAITPKPVIVKFLFNISRDASQQAGMRVGSREVLLGDRVCSQTRSIN